MNNHKNHTINVRKRCCPIQGSGMKKYVNIGKGIRMNNNIMPKKDVAVINEHNINNNALEKLKFGKRKPNIRLSF